MANRLVTQAVIDSLGCTELEANELADSASDFALKAQFLAKSYKSEYVSQAQDCQAAMAARASKDRLGRILSSKPTVSYGARNMWSNFKTLDAIFEKFSHANSMHQTGLSADRALTATLEALSNNRGFSGVIEAAKVVEGRRVYESLRSYRSLFSQIGL